MSAKSALPQFFQTLFTEPLCFSAAFAVEDVRGLMNVLRQMIPLQNLVGVREVRSCLVPQPPFAACDERFEPREMISCLPRHQHQLLAEVLAVQQPGAMIDGDAIALCVEAGDAADFDFTPVAVAMKHRSIGVEIRVFRRQFAKQRYRGFRTEQIADFICERVIRKQSIVFKFQRFDLRTLEF